MRQRLCRRSGDSGFSIVGCMRLRRHALGAIAAQFSQAIGSFLLHVLAYRYSGSDGLGRFALTYGVIVLATAVITGFVGDPLTVLPRAESPIRRALQNWALLVMAGVGLSFTVGALVTGTLDVGAAVLFGVTGIVFVAEDTMRRLLMATMRFGALLLVDVTALVVAVGFVIVAHTGFETDGIVTMLTALLIGQALGIVVGVIGLPGSERWLVRRGPADMAAVWRYGSWRGLQQTVRPAMMAIVRAMIVAGVSLTSYGRLESARVYVAPAMLMVGGAASYLFASYAKDQNRSLEQLMRRADRAVMLLVATTIVAGAVAVLSSSDLGGFLADDGEVLSRWAVAGWSAYAAATAAVTPYGSLAAVRGRQAAVLAIRVAESVLSIAGVAVLLVVDGSIMVVPFVLAAAALVSGVALRVNVLTGLTSSRGVHISTTAE